MSQSEPNPDREASEDVVDKPRGGRGGCVFGCLFGGVILYVLSPPLVTMVMLAAIDGGWGAAEAMESVFTVVYAPLQWL